MADSQTEIYTIFCVIAGEVTLFPIEIESSKPVGILKDMIKAKKMNTLANVDADVLILWKLHDPIPGKDVKDRVAALGQNLPVLAIEMHPTDDLSDCFPETPPRKSLHVIVELPNLPSAGEKHGWQPDVVGQKRSLPGKDTEQDDQVMAPSMKRTRNPPWSQLKCSNSNSNPFSPTGSTARRDLTVDALYQRLNRYRFVMVRGTPASGKTTLAQLLMHHISTQEPGADPIFISSWTRDTHWSAKLWPEYKPGSSNIIVIDEAQLTYWDLEFWNNFLKPIDPTDLDRIILFASYGTPSGTVSVEGTPMVIPDCNRVSLRPVDHGDEIAPAGLFLTADEFADMVKRLYPAYVFKEDFLDYVFNVTAGHTGAVNDLLWIVAVDESYRQFKRDGVEYSFDIFQREFPMYKLWSALNSVGVFRRGLPTYDALQDLCVARVFRAVLNNNHVREKSLDPEDQKALERCFKSGWLHAATDQEGTLYIFTTELHRWFIDYYLGTNVRNPTLIVDEDILNFAIRVIKLFCPQHLIPRQIIGASNKQRPPEAQFQDEFYRCCHKYSEGSLISFPEFGDRTGEVDFYIPFKQWGVGLLRDGGRLEKHSSRFIGSGAYAKMGFIDYILLDFRRARSTKKHPSIPNLYHVVFNGDDYRQVEIQKGSSLETIDKFELLNA